MKIWVDIANSPQVLFMRPIVKELEKRGHSLVITTRRHSGTVALADRYGLSHTVMGAHGEAILSAGTNCGFKKRERKDLVI